MFTLRVSDENVDEKYYRDIYSVIPISEDEKQLDWVVRTVKFKK